MKLEEKRILLIAATCVLTLGAAAPALSMLVPIRNGSERFSELWLLGSNQTLENYPFNVSQGEKHRMFIGAGNHLGYPAYYTVYVKLSNQTQLLPSLSDSEASPLPPLYEFRFFLCEGDTWESPLDFEFRDVSFQGDSVSVGGVTINDVTFSVGGYSTWDSENRGFYFNLFFELWLYNMTSRSLQYQNRYVGVWLNVTGY